ncbi:MAG TPA: NUDIX hydrolase, partial [Leptolyngbyaceae cyanobacterium]
MEHQTIEHHTAALVTVRSAKGQLWQDKLRKSTGEIVELNFSNISETLEEGEEPLDAAVRGIQEELGLSIHPTRFCFSKTEDVRKMSPTKGYLKDYTFHHFDIWLHADETAAACLQVEENSGIVYLEWRPISAQMPNLQKSSN